MCHHNVQFMDRFPFFVGQETWRRQGQWTRFNYQTALENFFGQKSGFEPANHTRIENPRHTTHGE